MDEKFLILHKLHVESFFENFFSQFDARNSIEEKKSYLDFTILLEKQRLQRYESEGLNPSIFADHRLIADDIKDIIDKLEYMTSALFKEFSFISLDYGEQNDNVIKILYENLYPDKIKIHLEVFKLLFSEGNYYLEKVMWYGSEAHLVMLFSSLKVLNNNILQILSEHFINHKSEDFKPKQLSVSKSKASLNYRGKDQITHIISLIKDIKVSN